MDTHIVSGITSHGPGYISEADKDLEQIVGLQTDKPLKRAFMPYGGIKMAEQACQNYGYEPDPSCIRSSPSTAALTTRAYLMLTLLK